MGRGLKHVCNLCGCKYYDLGKVDHICPKCNGIEQPKKRKGWATPYGFIDTTDPITYEEAVKIGQEAAGNL